MTNIINRQWLLAKRPFDDRVQGLGCWQDYYSLPSAGDNWRPQKKHNPPCANNSRSIGFVGIVSPNVLAQPRPSVAREPWARGAKRPSPRPSAAARC